jgi:sodium/bile acid cotransporter 7
MPTTIPRPDGTTVEIMAAGPRKSWRPDWFLVGLASAVALAWLAPTPGAKGGWLHPELLNKLGVALIFFLHGAGISFAALKAGTLRWPLHVLVQVTTFVLFPLIGLLTLKLLGGAVSPDLGLGFFFLCALPSTVSSSVALTAVARGNVPAAVFNATLSNLLGVFATPLWLGVVLERGGHPLPLGRVIADLLVWLVLPLVGGQLCRPLVGAAIQRHKKGVQLVDRVTILVLVYTSFCDSVVNGVWSGHGLGAVAATLAFCVALLALVMTCVWLASAALGFPFADRITATFCGSKKTLASGVPMAQLVFHGHPGLSLVLLPLMIYHPLQLVVCGWFAGRWASGEGGARRADQL